MKKSCVLTIALLLFSQQSFAEDTKEFVRAAAKGDLPKVIRYLQKGVNIDATVSGGATALLAASQQGHAEVVKYLLEKSAKADVAAMIHACLNGHSKIVDIFLEHGVNPNAQNSFGATPLIAASAGGHFSIVTALLRRNVEVKTRTTEGKNALDFAKTGGHTEIAQLLRYHMPDSPNTFIKACALEQRAVVRKILEEGSHLNDTGPDGETPLYMAALMGHAQIAEELIEAGADVNVRDADGRTPLIAASEHGHSGVVAALLRSNPGIDTTTNRSDKKEDASHTFAYTSLAKNERTTFNTTALFLAAQNGFSDVVKQLLHHGSHIDLPAQNGATPLYIACQQGHADVVKHLLAKDANPGIKTQYGWLPLFAAAHKGYTDIVVLLLDSGADVNAKGKMLEIPQTVRGPSALSMQEVRDVTALYIAALSGQSDNVRMLIARGAKVNQRASNGETALDAASRIDNNEIVTMLRKVDQGQDRISAVQPAIEAKTIVSHLDGQAWIKLETSMGNIIIELEIEKSPISSANFLRYVKEKHFDGTVFHRVIPNFMIQGGGFTTKLAEKETHEQIVNESSNGLKNDRGTVTMARMQAINSATCQFFINHKNNDSLNHGGPHGGYAVFGKVVEGMDVVDKIAQVRTTTKKATNGKILQNCPVETVEIKSALVVHLDYPR